MTTSILTACLQRLETLGISPELPIAWPGINFTQPDTGMWLEAKLFPNEPMNYSMDNDGCHAARGFFQVIVGYRPGVGQINPSLIADAVIAHFSKGTPLGPVRVVKSPWQSPEITEGSFLMIPVTIPYYGLTS